MTVAVWHIFGTPLLPRDRVICHVPCVIVRAIDIAISIAIFSAIIIVSAIVIIIVIAIAIVIIVGYRAREREDFSQVLLHNFSPLELFNK